MRFRLQLWTDSMRLAMRSPVLGTGLGTYAAAIPPYRTDIDETRAEFAESDLVQLACEAGAAGLVVLGGFLWVAARRSRHRLEEAPGGSRSQGVLIGAMAAVVTLLIHGLFDFNTHIPSNALLFVALLGMIASSHPREAEPRMGSSVRGVTALLVFLITVGAAGRCLTIGYSRDALVNVDPPRAEPDAFAELAARIGAARDFAPGNPEAAFKQGLLYNEEAYRSPNARRYRDTRFGQAKEAFEEAVRLAPAQGRYWFELAWTEANLARDEQADPLFEHAIHLEPTSSRIRVNYALYLASRGRIEESLEQLERGRVLIPGISPYEAVSTIGPYVENAPDVLRRAAGDGPEAEAGLERYLAEGDP